MTTKGYRYLLAGGGVALKELPCQFGKWPSENTPGQFF